MGYHIYFRGEVTIHPPLQEKDRELLEYIFDSERKKKDVFFQAPILPDELETILRQDSYIGREFGISADGTVINTRGEESSYDAGRMEQFWKQITNYVLQDYLLQGELDWDASDSNEGTGIIWVSGKQVEAVPDEIRNPGPNWNRVQVSTCPCGGHLGGPSNFTPSGS